MSASRTRPDWASYRDTIEYLYWIHDQQLPRVMEIMRDQYGFVATAKMYKKHFKEWDLVKNCTTEESMAMYRIAEHRRLTENKETEFFRRGKLVKPANLRRFAKRQGLTARGAQDHHADEQISTPPNITYRTPEGTPEPDPQGDAISSGSMPSPPARTPDVEEPPAVSGEVVGWNNFGCDGNSPAFDVPWALPLSAAFHPSDMDVDLQEQPAGFMPEFTADSFAPEWAMDGGQGFLYGSDPWSVSAHGWSPDAPWPYDQQQEQSYSPVPMLDAGMSATNRPDPNGSSPFLDAYPLGVTAQPIHHPINGIPAPTVYIPHNTSALNVAVACHKLEWAAALLEAGADPNSPVPGGITPLHYAAYMRNVDMVRLLVTHGASLDAVTEHGRSVLLFAVRSCPRHNQEQAGGDDDDLLAYAININLHLRHDGQGSDAQHPHYTLVHHNDADAVDTATVRTIEALFDFPTHWAALRRSLDRPDCAGRTPLMMAAAAGLSNTAGLLFRAGARPDARDSAGCTAHAYAARGGHRAMVRLLLLADPAVSDARDLGYLLRLSQSTRTQHRRHRSSSSSAAAFSSISAPPASTAPGLLIADELVRICRETRGPGPGHGMLEGLLTLARQQQELAVLEVLSEAVRKVGM
ncbi:hypothetical protein VTJ49DRAFT_5859 [Mycothermus thermophilus]|uniref:Clr5 domain-containing protein n=1 Tax=Humicola insolens TaxID=85995 RepID=A0ABR3V2J8_HUMIN